MGGMNVAAIRQLAPGETLFYQGDVSLGFFRIIRGTVRLLRHTEDGVPVTLHVARAGESFAEAALFATHYHCDAIADEPTEVVLQAKLDWLGYLAQCPADIHDLLGGLAREVQRLRSRLVVRESRSAAERIRLALQVGANSEGLFLLPGTVKVWASELGLSHECVYRTLARLARSGEIKREGGQIRWLGAVSQ